MFHDERIEATSGKIYRNGILLITIITAVSFVLQWIYLNQIQQFNLCYLLTEIFILITGIVLCCYGEGRMLGRAKDERYFFDKYHFYYRFSKMLLWMGLFGFALEVPFDMKAFFSHQKANEILLIFELAGLIYLSYFFKKNKIYFNYSFIEDTPSLYFKKVGIYIAKLILVLGCIYLISFLVSLTVFQDASAGLTLLFAFLISSISLGGIYLLLSGLEKLNYDEEEGKKGSISLGIAGGLIAVLALCSIILQSIYIQKANNEPNGYVVAQYLMILNQLSYVKSFFEGLFLSYFILKANKSKFIRLGVGMLCITLLCELTFDLLDRGMMFIFTSSSEVGIMYQFQLMLSIFSFIFSILYLLSVFFLILGLVKDYHYSKGLFVIIVINVISFIVIRIIRSVRLSDYHFLNIAESGITFVTTLILLYIGIRFHQPVEELEN